MPVTVPRGDVLTVLEAHHVAISCLDEAKNAYLLAGNGVLVTRIFPKRVNKIELRYLERKFNIPIHLFWHTEMLAYKPGENPS